jgi:methyltransferase (TIGR00027 family)
MRRDRASRTAVLIARSLEYTSGDRMSADLVAPESVALSKAEAADGSWLRRALESFLVRGGGRPWIGILEGAVLPGIQLHYAVRKRYIDDAVRGAIADGARQVVVIGAGLDALALRLTRRQEGVRCYEVDHPATQALKARALARIGLPAELFLIPADLSRRTLWDALATSGYDPRARTCFVAEGLTMYLPEEAVQCLLLTCTEHAPRGSRFVWTFMERDAEGRVAFRRSRRAVVDRWLRARGEPFMWGIAREEVPAFVEGLGLESIEIVGDGELRERYLVGWSGNPALAAGEMISVVRRP